MYLFQGIDDLRRFLTAEQVNNRTVGFVPTMGALHDGHLSLIRQSKTENQITVCSIFVNPTQFNDAADLDKYPRMPGKDLEKLASVGCHAVFLPQVEEIYPPGLDLSVTFDWNGLHEPMEGAHRPGHFAGVAQVVKRLLDLVKPDHLYMGQKDYQQLQIIRQMVKELKLPVKVHRVPTVREADGLAMSSRNMLLSEEHRAEAPLIYNTLLQAGEKLQQGVSVAELEAWALEQLSTSLLRPEYFTLADAETLQPVQDTQDHKHIVACTAVWAGTVRLIDNHLLK